MQERSALALLGDVFQRFEGAELPASGDWSLAPADLWSDALQQELINSEETGQQGSITHAYASVLARHGSRLTPELKRLLYAVVLSSKLGLQVSDKNEAIEALGEPAGVPLSAADKGIRLLQEEYNVIEWDQAFKAFDILGDAVPRNQFLALGRTPCFATSGSPLLPAAIGPVFRPVPATAPACPGNRSSPPPNIAPCHPSGHWRSSQ